MPAKNKKAVAAKKQSAGAASKDENNKNTPNQQKTVTSTLALAEHEMKQEMNVVIHKVLEGGPEASALTQVQVKAFLALFVK